MKKIRTILNKKKNQKMIYGNTPFNLLTIIIERISGMRFKDFADKHLFIPLGMYSTTYRVDNSSIVKNRATGYIMEKDSIFSHYNKKTHSKTYSTYSGNRIVILNNTIFSEINKFKFF